MQSVNGVQFLNTTSSSMLSTAGGATTRSIDVVPLTSIYALL